MAPAIPDPSGRWESDAYFICLQRWTQIDMAELPPPLFLKAAMHWATFFWAKAGCAKRKDRANPDKMSASIVCFMMFPQDSAEIRVGQVILAAPIAGAIVSLA
jgi:hypothetical protein